MYEDIIYEVEGNVATIKFNRPTVANAFSELTFQELPAALKKAEQNPDVRAIIITGEGKMFCGGGDINMFREQINSDEGPGLAKELFEATGRMAFAIRHVSKPTIAAINGAAAGAGMGVALACDFRVMEENAVMLTAFVNMAFSGDTGLGYFLQQMLGTHKATELMMLSQKVSSQEAKELGLVTEIVPSDQLAATALAFAQKLAKLPTKAVASQKELLNRIFYKDIEQHILLEAEYMHDCSKSEDHIEAVDAFLNKRRPEFKGH